MKKSTRKVINHLRQYVGHKVIRTRPACGDWSYMGDSPLVLVGFTPDGRIKCCQILGKQERILPIYFTDRNWITYKKALRAKGNKLNKWKGKRIRRIRPTVIFGDRSYMSEAPTLISASKHHLVIICNDIDFKGEKRVLSADYANPEDWELVE